MVEPISTWASVAAPFDLTYIDPEWEQAALAGAREYVDQLVERLRARCRRCWAGESRRCVDQTALDISANLIVMSTRAHTGPARALLGSVADAVVRQAQPPVLLVPHGSATAAASLAAEPGLVGPVQPGS